MLMSSGRGGGIVVDGAYFRGADGRSGEWGFLRAPTEDGGIQQVQKLVSLSGLAKHLAADGLTLADALAAERSARAETSGETWIDRVAQRLYVPLEAINCLVNPGLVLLGRQIGRASGRERVCTSVYIVVVSVSFKKKITIKQ